MSIRLIILMLFMSSKMLLGQLDTLVLEPTKDTYIKAILSGIATYTGQSAQNGLDSLLAIQKMQVPGSSPATYYVKRNLLQFDLAELPIGAVVTSAKLYLHKTLADSLTRYIKARMITQAWSESDVTWSEIATKTNSSTAVEQSYNHGDTMVFDLTAMLALWTCKNVNYGVMISPTADNQTGSAYNMPFDFFSREAMVGKRPKLNITYYLPINAVADITPASNSSSNDGAVEIIVGGGAGTGYSYQWYDSNFNSISTSKNLSSKVAGLYGLKITDGAGGVFRKMFIIPSESSSVTVTVRPGSEFGQDAYFTASTESSSQLKSGAVANLGLTNGTVSPGNKAEFVHHLDLDFDVLKGFEISSASVSYKQSNSIDTMMTTSVYNITSPWTEDCVCNGKRPTTGASFASIASRTGSFPSLQWSVDLADHFNSLIEDDSGNFGFMFTPDSVKAAVIAGGGYTLNAYPSENSVSSNRPLFSLTINPILFADVSLTLIDSSEVGSIVLFPRGGHGDYKYCWNDNFLTESEFEVLRDSVAEYFELPEYADVYLSSFDTMYVDSPGSYSYTVTDSTGAQFSSFASISYSLTPGAHTGVNILPNQITRTQSSYSGTSTEETSNFLCILENGITSHDDGELTFQFSDLSGTSAIGFREYDADTIGGGGGIAYGVKVVNHMLYFISNGIEEVIGKVFYPFDKFSIGLESGEFYLKRNGELIRESSELIFKGLLIEAYLTIHGSSINVHWNSINIHNKFICPAIRNYNIPCEGGTGRIAFAFYPCAGIHWVLSKDNVEITSGLGSSGDISDLEAGQYILNVITNSCGNYEYVLDVAYVVDWTNLSSDLSEVLFQTNQNNLYFPNEASNIALAYSLNELRFAEDGWFEFELRKCRLITDGIQYQNLFGHAVAGFLIDQNSNIWTTATALPSMNYINVFNNESTNVFNVSNSTNYISNKTLRLRFERKNDHIYVKLMRRPNLPEVVIAEFESTFFSLHFKVALMAGSQIINGRSSKSCMPFVQYATLDKELNNTMYAAQDGILYFDYNNEYNQSDHKLRFNVYDRNNAVVLTENDIPNDVNNINYPCKQSVMGNNKYKLHLSEFGFLNTGMVYRIEVINNKKERFFLQFKY